MGGGIQMTKVLQNTREKGIPPEAKLYPKWIFIT